MALLEPVPQLRRTALGMSLQDGAMVHQQSAGAEHLGHGPGFRQIDGQDLGFHAAAGFPQNFSSGNQPLAGLSL